MRPMPRLSTFFQITCLLILSITRRFKAWDTVLLSSLAYGPYSLSSACFGMIACTGLPSALFFHLLIPIDFRHFPDSLTNLILVFLLFFFHLVSPEIISLRFHHRTYLPDDQHFWVFFKLFLLLQYLASFTFGFCSYLIFYWVVYPKKRTVSLSRLHRTWIILLRSTISISYAVNTVLLIKPLTHEE